MRNLQKTLLSLKMWKLQLVALCVIAVLNMALAQEVVDSQLPPSAADCKPHIEAAIDEFIKQSSEIHEDTGSSAPAQTQATDDIADTTEAPETTLVASEETTEEISPTEAQSQPETSENDVEKSVKAEMSTADVVEEVLSLIEEVLLGDETKDAIVTTVEETVASANEANESTNASENETESNQPTEQIAADITTAETNETTESEIDNNADESEGNQNEASDDVKESESEISEPESNDPVPETEIAEHSKEQEVSEVHETTQEIQTTEHEISDAEPEEQDDSVTEPEVSVSAELEASVSAEPEASVSAEPEASVSAEPEIALAEPEVPLNEQITTTQNITESERVVPTDPEGSPVESGLNQTETLSNQTQPELIVAQEETTEINVTVSSEIEAVNTTQINGTGIDSTPEQTIEEAVEEEEIYVFSGPGELKSRDHINEILQLDQTVSKRDEINVKTTLKDLKKTYEASVKPIEQLYKFKDISYRQLGDAELFTKPLLLFLGPWSAGKTSAINYLLDIEYTKSALKTTADPTNDGFTIITHNDNDQWTTGPEVVSDWSFSSLQKYGNKFLEVLRGRKLNNPLLKKVTIVDTPGIVENRKQNERQYPWNDVNQWFIDRADRIYVVFDPTKLDVGFELEALLDQLKGRESQVRFLLNKADSVRSSELMKLQASLLWNLSPVLSSLAPPVVYVGSFWSKPYFPNTPATVFDAQEVALIQDIKSSIDNRVENKINLARRHAVRVRNHAKIVDCYLTTYYSQKSIFANKKKVAEEVVQNPEEYNIYQGVSTLTNVSRYDLPDPDIYREFFKINALYDFKPLSATCSYFKGCPLDKLDVAISYDLPQLLGKHRKLSCNTESGPATHKA